MPSTFYDVLSEYYDFLQEEVDANAWASYVHKLANIHCTSQGDGKNGARILCDLGCGTGKTTIEFSKFGYDIIGVDNSEQMLNKARALSSDMGLEALWLQQDIASYELYGTADVFVSLLDTINHITNPDVIDKVFASFKNYMNPGGVFIFDIGTLKHFKDTLGDNIFYEDYDNFTLLWDNEYKNESSISSMTLFYSEDGKNYKRVDGKIREKYYSLEFITQMANKNGLTVEGVYSDLSMEKPNADDERIFIVIKRGES